MAINVAEKLQAQYEDWLTEVIHISDREVDEEKAFKLFWARMSPEDAVGALEDYA